MNRFLKLYRRFIQETDGDRDLSLAHCVDICYLQQVATLASKSKIIEDILADSGLVSDMEKVKRSLSAHTLVRILPNNQMKFDSCKPTVIGNGRLDLERGNLNLGDVLKMQGDHAKNLQFLVDCLHTNFPLLVVADNCHELVRNLRTIALLWNKKLNRILLNDRSDTTQLLGCFE